MVPTGSTTRERVDPGSDAALDDPIPEVEAELDAADHEGHEAFLRAVQSLVHAGPDPVPAEAVDRGDPEDQRPDEEDLGDWLPGVWVAEERRGSPRSRRHRRARGRRAAQLAAPAADPPHVHVTALRRRDRRRERVLAASVARARTRGATTEREPEPETLAEHLARVEAPLLPRRSRRSRPRTPRWFRRTTRLTVVGALIAGCVALPWVAPDVPRVFSDLLPDGDSSVHQVADPPIEPSDAFVGPVGIEQQGGPYAGVRLQAAGQPREVRVPRLHVDSDVVPISGQSGVLLPPDDPQVLGWWREGKPAGAQYGSTVVTGHTVHTGGGALDNLDKLVVGDTVRVRTDAGWIRYQVRRTRIYSTDELARDAEKIFRLGGNGRLVLITCDDWNGEFYESNAVVFAVPVDDEPTVSGPET